MIGNIFSVIFVNDTRLSVPLVAIPIGHIAQKTRTLKTAELASAATITPLPTAPPNLLAKDFPRGKVGQAALI